MKITPDIMRSLLDPAREAERGELLDAAGWTDPEQGAALLGRLVRAADPPAAPAAELLAEIAASPDPDLALLGFGRLADASIAPAALFRSPLLERPIRELLVRLFSTSRWLTDIVVRNPGLLWWLIDRRTIEEERDATSLRREADRQIAAFRDERRRINSLKRFQRREILRIGARDLLGLAGVETVTRELSALADAVVGAALGLAAGGPSRELAGEARNEAGPAAGFAVVALGKLGGRELNYSSDIDLLYVYDERRMERADAVPLARRLTSILSEQTEEGILYRVDLRLRPDGESGPVAVSTAEHRGYLEQRARFWERQALLKARIAAGDRRAGAAFIDQCERAVFHPLADPAPVGEIRAMRDRGLRLLDPARRETDIKRMPGGIRDIEFLVQALQLLHGRGRAGVRDANTIAALDKLEEHGLLAHRVHETLAGAYRLFRTVEHRLQLLRGTRTHRLPAEAGELRRLAGRVAYSGLAAPPEPDEFVAGIGGAVERVRGIFEGFFPAGPEEEIPLLLSLPPGEESVARLLARYGIAEGERARRFLDSIVYGDFPRLEGPATLAAAEKHLPAILAAVGETPDPSLTLKNLARIVRATGAVRTTLELLGAGGDLLRLLLAVAAYSTRHAEFLAGRIELLDRLAVGAAPPPVPPAGPVEEIARWRAESTLFLHCARPLPEAGRREIAPRLAEIVEAAIAVLFEEAGGSRAGVALFALGSLGAGDLHAGSDLDLVAVIADDGDAAAAAAAVRTLIDLAASAGAGPVDARLRGEGGGAPLVQTIGRYRRYYDGRASLWERIAFARCRFLCGDREVGARFEAALPAMLRVEREASLPGRLRDERGRLEALSPGASDIKHAPGGLYDIHFVAAAARLVVDPRRGPGAVDPALDRLVEAGLLERADRETLGDAHDRYWLARHAAALHGIHLPPLPGRAEAVDRYLGRLAGLGDDGWPPWLAGARAAVRDVFDRFVDRLG